MSYPEDQPLAATDAQPASSTNEHNATTEQDMTKLSTLELQELTQQLFDEEANKRPLISESLPILTLREEYERGAGNFVNQIDWLQERGFTHVRRTRGDGDCFYRSLAFAWLEQLLTSTSKELSVATALSLLDSSLDVLKAAGFQELVFEDFYDVLANLIRHIVVPNNNTNELLTPETLLQAFQDPETSNCIVVFLRMYTSAVIRTSSDSYAPFLFHPETGQDIAPQEFCERFVEATGKEAGNVFHHEEDTPITALTRALKMNIQVAYLDGHASDGVVNFVDFVNTEEEEEDEDGGENGSGDVGASSKSKPAVLLYRPGHYDILERHA
ncbi:peptidase C65 Otubain-domain-containing protein [Cytidiella melzeri]|nr:peptidase C65 Otubain-domain-containing protein [Cytidiella melzeri]